ncbi:MAG: hypothetical protein LUD51_00360 [Clostridia bacterium]|nr:hypothetical protein [Clostridia bacterium]
MKRFDFRISGIIFRKMIGKEFVKIRCDEIYNECVTQIAGLYIGGKVYKLENLPRPLDNFGDTDDVGVFGLAQSQDYAIFSAFMGREQTDYPVGKKIRSVKLVNERQRLSERGELTYEVLLTRAIIFSLDDEELLFEKESLPIADDIIIRRGQNLLETVASETEFLKGWIEGWQEGMTPECTRDICNIQ